MVPPQSDLDPVRFVDLDAGENLPSPGGVVLGVSADGPRRSDDERMMCVITPQQVPAVLETVRKAPVAVHALADLLRLITSLSVEHAMVAESFAYSMLLASSEFRTWRASRPRREVVKPDSPSVLLSRDGEALAVVLNRPERHNAFGVDVRDGLLGALAVADADPSVREVRLSGEGRSFCSGGDLDEFGTAADVAMAHIARTTYSAGLAVHRLRDKVRPTLHGACLGAGIEVPAFAAHVAAHSDARFGLPELGLGLIPGAGGTVSLSRRIGLHRTAWLALTRQTIDAHTALAWGLVDELLD